MFQSFGFSCDDDGVVLLQHNLRFWVHDVVVATFDTHDDAVCLVADGRVEDCAVDEWIAFFKREALECDMCTGDVLFFVLDARINHLFELVNLFVRACYHNLITWVHMFASARNVGEYTSTDDAYDANARMFSNIQLTESPAAESGNVEMWIS